MEIARLRIAVDAAGAKRELRQFGDAAKTATGTIKNMLGPLAAIGTIAGSLSKLVAVQRQFDVLNAGLITATGSAEKAAAAFEALQDFAAATPFTLDQAVDGFTKLVNLGLTPSEAALTSYGNTASAMGKDLSQMIEAVADATTGEFERLKEFGIKSKSEGDNVSFTFQGVTKTVGKNAAEIEGYLKDLGENQFAGAMALRVETLDGAISNFGDTFDGLFREISSAGVGDLIEDQVRIATSAMQELTDQVASGQLQAELSAIAGKFDGFSQDVGESLLIISGLFEDETGYWGSLADNNVKNMIETFKNLPENVRALIQIMTVEIASGFDQVTAYARAFNDGINAIFTADTFEGVGARLDAELNIARSARESSIGSILDEHAAAVSGFDDQIDASKRLREEYDNREKEDGDRLAKFKVRAAEQGAATAELSKSAIKAAKESEKANLANAQVIIDLAESIYQASLNAEDLAKRQAKLSLNKYATPGQIASVQMLAGELQRVEDIAARKKEFGGDPAATVRGTVNPLSGGPFDDQFARFEAEREAEELRYAEQQTRLQEASALDLLTKQEYYALEQQLAQENADRLMQIEQAKTSMLLSTGEQVFGDLAGLAKTYAGEQSGLYKTMFAASKAFSIAQSLVAIQTGIALAAANPWPVNLAAMASVAAATGSLVSNIASVAAPSFDGGGFTGTGARSGGMDGKGGFMAMLHPNETVLDHTKGQGAGGGVTVNVIESKDKAGTQEKRTDADGKESVDVFVSDIYGDGPRGKAIQRAFGLSRVGQ